MNDEGLADPAIVIAAFVSALRLLTGLLGGTVVGGEYDEGVVLDSEGFDVVEQQPDRRIQIVSACGGKRVAVLFSGRLRLESGRRLRSCLKCAMDRVVRDVGENEHDVRLFGGLGRNPASEA